MIVGDTNICGSWFSETSVTYGIEMEELVEENDTFVLNIDDVPTRTEPSSESTNAMDISAVPAKSLPHAK